MGGSNSNNHGIRIKEDVEGTILQNCIIDNMGAYGIYLGFRAGTTRFLGCTIKNSYSHGLKTRTTTGWSTDWVIIQDCSFENNGACGIHGESVDSWIITNNYFVENTSHGIHWFGQADSSIISSNRFYRNGGYGLYIERTNCNKNIVIGNSFHQNVTGEFLNTGIDTQIGHNNWYTNPIIHSGFEALGLIDMDANDAEFRLRDKTPATAGATGTKGEICWDTSYIYICTTTDTWKRTAIASW